MSQYEVDEKYDLENGKGRIDDAIIAEVTEAFFDDPNLDRSHLDLEDDSPYPEVRSAVANTDDPSMPCGTLRAWFIGFLCAIIIPVTISSLVAQLCSFPVGIFLARTLPNWKIFGLSLNPGPFSVKEHVLITTMATVAGQSAYATDIIAVQRVFYKQQFNFAYQWFVVLSTQMIGFALGGVGRRFLVAPPSMIWPANLVFCALFNTLHSQEYAGIGNRGGISRQRFFLYVFLGSFSWLFLPLSGWAQITYTGSPLVTPWWAEANVMVGFFFFFWIVTPALYWTNAFYTSYLPILSSGTFDNTGNPYNVTAILNPDLTLNLEKYQAYSPLFLSTTFALAYGLSFASITATLVHAFLYFRKQIWTQARRSLNEQPDIHARLMSRYKQVPEWWYLVVFIVMFVFGVLAIEIWPTEMPVWAFVLSLAIAFVYLVPIGMIQAITNQQIGLNVITELIIGYALPGRPIAMMMFKTWGYISMIQGLQFASDFKLGHYMKVPPRDMFFCQVVATAVAGTVQLGVQAWMFSNIDGICDHHQKDDFICPSTQVFGAASIIWGVIGPARQFSRGNIFYPLTFFFLIGAILPCIPYFTSKKFPNSPFKYVNFPVIFNGTGLIPPATAVNYVPWGIVGFIFQYVIRRRHFSWWTKYNYVLSAGLDSGLAIATVVIFFCLQYPKNGSIGATTIQTWAGNTIYQNTDDWNGVPRFDLPASGKFGPEHW
ncbi:hypothetical protein Clacol_006145 [Clathrus columnatus]|uniref:OPT oligopeptide transporter n=1 Tax=Clathrus columnatus TaxID=1419009 RepID=A0AAV5AE42_9AGAM|nr:hypothetical protein Clacol_006145 [Clathrus columnatus]